MSVQHTFSLVFSSFHSLQSPISRPQLTLQPFSIPLPRFKPHNEHLLSSATKTFHSYSFLDRFALCKVSRPSWPKPQRFPFTYPDNLLVLFVVGGMCDVCKRLFVYYYRGTASRLGTVRRGVRLVSGKSRRKVGWASLQNYTNVA